MASTRATRLQLEARIAYLEQRERAQLAAYPSAHHPPAHLPAHQISHGSYPTSLYEQSQQPPWNLNTNQFAGPMDSASHSYDSWVPLMSPFGFPQSGGGTGNPAASFYTRNQPTPPPEKPEGKKGEAQSAKSGTEATVDPKVLTASARSVVLAGSEDSSSGPRENPQHLTDRLVNEVEELDNISTASTAVCRCSIIG